MSAYGFRNERCFNNLSIRLYRAGKINTVKTNFTELTGLFNGSHGQL